MLKFITTSAVLVALAYGGLSGLQEVQGDQVASSQRPPYQVTFALYNKKNNSYQDWCRGTIISNEWILTAGSCFDRRQFPNKNSSLVILTGGDTLEAKSHLALDEPAYYIWYFMNELTGMAVNDIMLFRIPESFELDANFQPIQLYNQDEETVAGSNATLSGWATAGNIQSPKNLNLSIVSRNQCNNWIRGGLYDGQICAVYDGSGPCPIKAYPGSPLTINGRLAGILSWGSKPCAPREEASVYAEIGYFRNWIKNETNI